ncbi:terminase [Burkholderia vietnamiensis]|uniref:terminase n=1 Tax=Burkholderia vietnamiensis TaxID=60552 RepID=UPI002DD4327D|nr:terminase [Burkholderia vietnamiensis]MEC4595472.1 terminase [Burkholderia vietnamiensis]
MVKRADPECELLEEIASFVHDPLGFVLFAFPWGMGELAKFDGPDEWQVEILTKLGDGLITLHEAIQIAIASGHGIGKSAFVAWLILWAICTREDTRGVVTANTDTQLRTKTWPELMKWHRLCICGHWFEVTATAIFSKQPQHEKTWRIDAVPWSETNTEAFAGLHNQGNRILLVFDEGSAIADKIWEVAEGALTDEDTEIIWFVAGNPTRNTGRFRECFGRFKHRWIHKQVDSRTCRMTNKRQIAKWVADHGEDSDFVRVRVRGMFPRAGSMQFISSEAVQEAMKREAIAHLHDPLVMGVDVARFGDDQSVIYFRKGRDGRTHAPIPLRGLDTMALAARVALEYDKFRADGLFVDETGIGAGVVDRLRQLGYPVIGVHFGAKPDRAMPGSDQNAYFNKRAEMWGEMREWLKGGAIPNDIELEQELTGPEYTFRLRDGRDAILLESKEDMKKRGLASPDIADGLALTFAYPVMQRADAGRGGRPSAVRRGEAATDYDPYAEAHATGAAQTDYDPYN